MHHRERGLQRVIANAAGRETGHAQQTVGGDQDVAAPRSQVPQTELFLLIQVHIRGTIVSQKEQVLIAHGVVTAAPLKQGGGRQLLTGQQVVLDSRLVWISPGHYSGCLPPSLCFRLIASVQR